MKELETVADLREFLDDIQVRGAIQIRFLLDEENEAGATLVAGAMSVIDVRDNYTPIVATERWPIEVPIDRRDVIARCREIAHAMYRHEADEQFYCYGKRIVDMTGSHIEDDR